MNFYGMLYVSGGDDAVNSKFSSVSDKIDVYLKNAALLSLTLASNGYDFSLIVNDVETIRERVNVLGLNIDLVEIDFGMQVPEKIRFFSAHHKIDVFRYFSNFVDQNYSILLDIDVVCLRSMPSPLVSAIENGVPTYYDITNQVAPVYGLSTILRDMQFLSADIWEGRWAGGEYIGGTSEFFKKLISKIDLIYPRYLEGWEGFHHQGDEMLVSTALELLRHDRIYMFDIGMVFGIERYWSKFCKHTQRPIRQVLENVALIHLPQDKNYLASISDFRSGGYVNYQAKFYFSRLMRSGLRLIGWR